MPDRIRVLVADDHAVVRQGLRTFLGLQDDIEVVGEAADGAGAVEQARRLAPDVVLMDLHMPGTGGLEAIARLRAEQPAARVLVLTSFAEDTSMLAAMRAGAAGYLLKDVDPAALAQGIRAVHHGQVLLDSDLAGRLMEGPGAPGEALDALTDRERQVLVELAGGLANKEIARKLAVSEKTVKTHVSSILAKLRVQDRTQAALYAVHHGLAGATPPG